MRKRSLFSEHSSYIKHWLDSKEIVFYKRYVDDIVILYDQQKRNEHTILQKINEID